MKSKIIFVPENLVLEETIIQNPPKFKFDVNYAYYLVYDIILTSNKQLFKVEKWDLFFKSKLVKNYMVSKCAESLQAKKHNYNQHFDYLLENNIIWRRKYSEGVCRGYQLDPKYFAQKQRFICLLGFKNLKLVPDELVNEREFMPFNKWFYSKLIIDKDCAIKGLNESFNEQTNYYEYIKKCLVLSNFYNKIYNFSRKKYTDARIHSNFTRFPKLLRKCLNFDGEGLGEVDISSSVPFFIYYHLVAIVDDTKINKIYYSKFFKDNPFYCNALNITKNKVQLDEIEVFKYGNAVSEGTFYSQFINSFENEYYLKHSFKTLKSDFNGSDADKELIVKIRMLSCINSKVGIFGIEELVFKDFYPSIYEFLSVFKTRKYLSKSKIIQRRKKRLETQNNKNLKQAFQQHKKVSHLILQTESFFMLEVITKRLNKKYSNIPFFTLHDCIVTTENNIEFLKIFMIETFTETLGFSPSFKDKSFRPNPHNQLF